MTFNIRPNQHQLEQRNDVKKVGKSWVLDTNHIWLFWVIFVQKLSKHGFKIFCMSHDLQHQLEQRDDVKKVGKSWVLSKTECLFRNNSCYVREQNKLLFSLREIVNLALTERDWLCYLIGRLQMASIFSTFLSNYILELMT